MEQVLVICIDNFRVCIEHFNQLRCQLELKFHDGPIDDGVLAVDGERMSSVVTTNFSHIIASININKFVPVHILC